MCHESCAVKPFLSPRKFSVKCLSLTTVWCGVGAFQWCDKVLSGPSSRMRQDLFSPGLQNSY